METKNELVGAMTWKFHRILNKFSRLETTTIHLEDGREATHNDIHVLQAIGDIESLNVTELGAKFGITKSAASQKVTKLVSKGLVEKGWSVHSGKELQLSLTEAGWSAYRVHEQYHDKNVAEITKRLGMFSLEQIATVSVVFDVIESVIDERLD